MLSEKQKIAGAISYLESFEAFEIGHSPVLKQWDQVLPTEESHPGYESLFASHFDQQGMLIDSHAHWPAMQAKWGAESDIFCTSLTLGDLHKLVSRGIKPDGLVLFESIEEIKSLQGMQMYIADIHADSSNDRAIERQAA